MLARARLLEASAFGPDPAPVLYTVTVCKFIDQLQKLGRCGISHTFARILSSALQEIGTRAVDGEGLDDQA